MTLEKKQAQQTADYTYKQMESSQMTASAKTPLYQFWVMENLSSMFSHFKSIPVIDWDDQKIENFNFAELPRDFTMAADVYSSLQFKNNCNSPLNYEVYSCRPKDWDENNAGAAWNEACVDAGLSAGTKTDALLWPSDLPTFNKKFALTRLGGGHLEPGESAFGFSYSEHFNYNVRDMYDKKNDTNPPAQGPGCGCHSFLVRIQGDIAHENEGSNVTTSGATLDMIAYKKFHVKYPSDANLKTLKTFNGLPTVITPVHFSKNFNTLGPVSHHGCDLSDNLQDVSVQNTSITVDQGTGGTSAWLTV